MALTAYNKKRNFKTTGEPAGAAAKQKGQFHFVVQRHHASHIHYDFRLEMGGTLKSWAVPKGPSLNSADKRLAMMVEDHPVSYMTFEGVIPKGNYGAGTVELWDIGQYTPVTDKGEPVTEAQALTALKKGSLKFELQGKKLKGGFALVRLKNNDGKSWLLIKHRDKYATDKTYNSEDLSRDKKKEDKAAAKAPPKAPVQKEVKKKSLSEPPPGIQISNKKISNYIRPMLASVSEKPFNNKDWVFELKMDGYRAIAELEKKGLKLYSRNGLSFIEKYPPVTEALQKIKHRAVLDGEIVLLNEKGHPDFQKLQHYENYTEYPLVYYVFDLLAYEGTDCKQLPLIERKQLLKKMLGKNPVIRYCDHLEEKGIALFKKAVAAQLEGVIAKKKDSEYYIGVRSNEWLKIKHVHSNEAVIAGYTSPRGNRKYFGALVLGQYENGVLNYIGHTGTGFTQQSLKDTWNVLQPLITAHSPFAQKIKVNAPVTWVKPKMVVELNYSQITKDKMMRHPVFQRLRPDRDATDIKQYAQK